MHEGTENAGLAKPYQIVTDRIVAMLESGVVPWRRPWAAVGAPKNLASGNEYRGINTFMLAATGAMMGYASPWWLTFKQAKERGGAVRKGEHGAVVVFWKMLEKTSSKDSRDDADSGIEDGARKIPLLRYSTVFNAQQCDGIDVPPVQAVATPFDPIVQCERILAEMPRPPTVQHLEDRAFYRPRDDVLNMPPRELFADPRLYYSTRFHETCHSTGHPSRLDREAIRNPASFGSAAYAKEELVAEMGAAFLCARAGIEPQTLENSAAYIHGWIERLRGDPKLAVHASSQAQKAADWILGFDAPRLAVAEVVRGATSRAGRER